MSPPLRLGISPCPNDTFAFCALMRGEVDTRGLELEIILADVQELNEAVLRGELEVSKVSFHAALRRAEELWVLPSGSALGFGVGPLVLASADGASASDPRVLCPGRWTTASLLWQLFHPEHGRVEQVLFSEIMPALCAGRADLGVCIHEGRFTWREHGLQRVEDLGERWEAETGAPLPLGGIVAARGLGLATARRIQAAIRDSIEWARANPDECLPTMRSHAQELSDEVIRAHVELYVNPRTVDLGDEGRRALAALSELARDRGLLPRGAELEVLES